MEKEVSLKARTEHQYPFIDQKSPLPIYIQIYDFYRDLIGRGVYTRGDSFPSDNELTANISASLITVRQAMRKLAEEGLLHRVRGKGTIVPLPRYSRHLNRTAFTRDLVTKGFSLDTGTLLLEIRHPDGQIQEKLRITSHDEVFQIKRLRIINKIPSVIHYSYLPLNFGIPKEELEENNYSMIRVSERRKIPLGHTDDCIEAVVADAEEAQLLNIAIGMPLLKLSAQTYEREGQIIQLTVGLYRSDLYSFSLKIER